MELVIRDAELGDVEAITGIYNREVLGSTATFDTVPITAEARRAWLAEHRTPDRPAIVAVGDGAVLGWAALSSWSTRCAYARAAEVSVYVHHDHRGRGVGRLLLEALIARGRAAGVGVLLARICTEGASSVALHRGAGFRSIGTMRRVGEKFGRLLDIELMDLQLDESAD